MERRVFFSLLILCSLLVPVGGQQPPSQPSAPKQQNTTREDEQDVVRITTNLVQVDVVVTKDGKQVTDLKPEDFELFEDGRPQAITHFSYISNVPANASSGAPAPSPKEKDGVVAPAVVRPHDVRRTVAFVVDDLGMSLESMGQARRQLRKFVDEQLQPNDLVAIIRTGGDVGALQQFTTDKRLLHSAIDHLKWNQCSRIGINVFKPVTSPFMRQSENIEPCGGRSQLATMRTLRFVLQGMRELPGRKSMVFFSDSLPIENQETELQSTAAGEDQASDDPGTDASNTSISYDALLRRIAEMAIRASVVIYTVDTRGLQYTGLTAADSPSGSGQAALRTMQNTMNARSRALLAGREGQDLIARQTGGYLVRNSNDFGLQRVMEDQSGYYLLGYRPADETFNRRFHHLRARVKRSGLTLRTRAGFYGVSEDEARPAELTPGDELKRALMSPFGSSEITVRLTTFFANEATPGSLLRSFLYLDAHDLTFTDKPDGTHEAAFDLSSMVFGDNGTVVSRQDETATLRLRGPAYERAQHEGVVYTFDMPVKNSGAFQFRIAIRDQTSARIGAAGQFVQVPNLRADYLALSGIVVHSDEGLAPKPSSNVPAKPAADNITAGPAVRQFHQGSNLIAVYAVYNALLDPTTHLPRLTTQMRVLRDGKPIFTSDPAPIDAQGQTDLQRLINGSLLRLGPELMPGDYMLQIIVEDHLGKEKNRTAMQRIDFEVVK
jgi:VWFA-related protein